MTTRHTSLPTPPRLRNERRQVNCGRRCAPACYKSYVSYERTGGRELSTKQVRGRRAVERAASVTVTLHVVRWARRSPSIEGGRGSTPRPCPARSVGRSAPRLASQRARRSV